MPDYALEAIQDEQRRRRGTTTGRSSFPAVNRALEQDSGFARVLNRQTFGYEPDFAARNRAIAASVTRTGLNPQMQTVSLPSGGTISVPSGSRLPPGYSYGDTSLSPQASYELGFTGVPTSLFNRPIASLNPVERSYRAGYDIPSVVRPTDAGFGFQAGQAVASGLGTLGTLSRNAFAGLSRLFRGGTTQAPQVATQPSQPRRYFDFF